MAAVKTKKILIMEDDLAMREIVSRKLSSAAFEVRSAEDGSKGLELVTSFRPDLILMDLMMPGLDGFKVLEAIRGMPDKELAKVHVIVLSNLWSSNDILRVKALSVDDYLVKAYFTPDEILVKINEVLSKNN
jgi:DNA-binding response OmpR family regulator